MVDGEELELDTSEADVANLDEIEGPDEVDETGELDEELVVEERMGVVDEGVSRAVEDEERESDPSDEKVGGSVEGEDALVGVELVVVDKIVLEVDVVEMEDVCVLEVVELVDEDATGGRVEVLEDVTTAEELSFETG